MNTEKKKRKFLIVLNYWNGDREMAKAVAELIADLEPKFNDMVDFAFHRRFDAEQMTNALKDRLADKFSKVHELKCRRMNAAGYPFGPNEMFYDLLERMYNREWQTDYFAFLNLEADCCPLSPDWINKMLESYDDAYNSGKSAVGHIIQHPTASHLNGVAIYSTDFWQKAGGMNIIGGPAQVGYDTHHAPRVLPISKDTNNILLDFNRRTITETDLSNLDKNGERPYLYHGVKDMSALVAVRKKYVKYVGASSIVESIKTIACYFDKTPDTNIAEEERIIEMWKKTWKAYGYNPVVFSEWDASKHPHYAAIKKQLTALNYTASRKKENALILRWLAFDYYGGGLMTEYDVFPNQSFTSDDVPAPDAFTLLGNGSLAAVSSGKEALQHVTNAIKNFNYSTASVIPTDRAILDGIEDKFWLKEDSIMQPWNSGRWAEARMVHFSYAACKSASGNPTKSTFIEQYIKGLRP